MLPNIPPGRPAASPPSGELLPEDRGHPLQRLRDWLWGYDFFISYQWKSGGKYATALVERLRAGPDPCDVLLDKSDFTVGDDWKAQARADLRNTQRLIVIATREAVEHSRPVALEVESFARRSRRILPIVFGDDLQSLSPDSHPVLRHFTQDTIILAEDPDRLQFGPSDEVVRKIKGTHRLLRRRTLRLRLLATALAALALALAVVVWVAVERRQRHWRTVEAATAQLDQGEAALEADDAARAEAAWKAAAERVGREAPDDLASRLARCRREIDLLEALEGIDDRRWRVVNGRLTPRPQVLALYAAAFAKQGYPLGETDPEPCAAWVTGSTISARLVYTLDLLVAEDAPVAAEAAAILNVADGDAYRTGLRQAIRSHDEAGFEALIARDDAFAQLPFFIIAMSESPLMPRNRCRELLSHAWTNRPQNYSLLMSLGTVHSMRYENNRDDDNYARISYFRAAVSQRPNSVAAWTDLGGALMRAHKSKEALEASRRAVELDETDPLPRINLALAWHASGDSARAAESAQAAIRLDPAEALAHNALGVVYCDGTHNYLAAVRAFQEAIRLDPNEPGFRVNLGNAYNGTKNRMEAIAAYREAIRMDQRQPRAQLFLGLLLAEIEDMEGSKAAFQAALLWNNGDELIERNMPVILRSQGDLEGAEAACRAYLRDHPRNAAVQNLLGAVLHDKKNYTGAAAAFRTAIEIEPDLDQAHFNLGNALNSLGNLDDAIREYSTAVRLNPRHAIAHYRLGVLLAEREDWPTAVRALQTAAELAPDNLDVALAYAAAIANRGDVAKGLDHLRGFVRGHSSQPDAHNALALMLDQSGDVDGALAAVQNALGLAPKAAMFHYNRGEFFYQKKDHQACLKATLESIRLDSKFAPAHNNLGLAYLGLNDPDPAERAFREAIRLDPTYAKAHLNLGNVLYQKGDKFGAAHAYRNAVTHSPNYLKAHYNLAVALSDVGDYTVALAAVDRGIEIAPDEQSFRRLRDRILKEIEGRKSKKP